MHHCDYGQQLFDYYEQIDRAYHMDLMDIIEYIKMVFRDDIPHQKYADSNPIRRGSFEYAKHRLFDITMYEENLIQNPQKY